MGKPEKKRKKQQKKVKVNQIIPERNKPKPKEEKPQEEEKPKTYTVTLVDVEFTVQEEGITPAKIRDRITKLFKQNGFQNINFEMEVSPQGNKGEVRLYDGG